MAEWSMFITGTTPLRALAAAVPVPTFWKMVEAPRTSDLLRTVGRSFEPWRW